MSASKDPVPDRVEHNAFFPSDYSTGQYVPKKTDLDGAIGASQVTSGPRKILTIAIDERYLPTDGGLFSTGNHPAKTPVPLMHLRAVGYEIEVATLSGNMTKFKMWAIPTEDKAIKAGYEELLPALLKPRRPAGIAAELGPDSDYVAVFVPGGHGAMGGDIPDNPAVRDVLVWVLKNERPVVVLCHGPAALCAVVGEGGASHFAGYSLCAFPDSFDVDPLLESGCLLSRLTWRLGERLKRQGLTIVNDGASGQTHRDRLLLTGDSPLAANVLDRPTVETLTGKAYGVRKKRLRGTGAGGVGQGEPAVSSGPVSQHRPHTQKPRISPGPWWAVLGSDQ